MSSEIYAALGMQANPFPPGACKDFYFQTEATKRILDELFYGITARKGFLVLVGEVGLGKTSLLLQLLPRLEQAGIRSAWVFNTILNKTELLAAIAKDYGLPVPPAPHLAELLDTLHTFFLKVHKDGSNCAIVIDEAHLLDFQAMEVLRMLSNLELGGEKLVQILLAGQPELRRLLDQPELRQFRSRINLLHELPPLELAETGTYVNFKLSTAGSQLRLEGRALKLLWEASTGNFRTINLLMEKTLYAMVARGEQRLGLACILEGLREVAAWNDSLARGLRRMRLRRVLLWTGVGLAGSLLLGGWLLLFEPWRVLTPAPEAATPVRPALLPETSVSGGSVEVPPPPPTLILEPPVVSAPGETAPPPAETPATAEPQAPEAEPSVVVDSPPAPPPAASVAMPEAPPSDLAQATRDFLAPWRLEEPLREALYRAVKANDPELFTRELPRFREQGQAPLVAVRLQQTPPLSTPEHPFSTFAWQQFSEFGPAWLVLWRPPLFLERYALEHRSKEVVTLQERLDLLGYYRRGIDGKVGPGTWQAVERFQQEHGLGVTGVPDAATVFLLFTTGKKAQTS